MHFCRKRDFSDAFSLRFFFWGLQELFLLSSALQMVLQMKHLYCMQPFQASCLDKLHHKTHKKFKKEDVSLHFLRFKRSFLWKDFFFLMPLSKEATEVCVTLRPDIPVTLFSTSVIKTSQDFERNHHLFQAARFLVLERLIDLTDNGSNWFEE